MTDKLAWLALRGIAGVGPVLFHRLVQAFGGPAQVFQTPIKELCAVRGISSSLAQEIHGFRHWDRVEEHLSRLKAFGAEILTLDDPGYPVRLKEIPFPPPLIFIKGEIKPEDGLIDWTKSPEQIRNFIRAQTKPYPGAFALINGKKVTIWDADITHEEF